MLSAVLVTLAINGPWLAAPLRAQGLVQYEFTGGVTDVSGNLGVFGPFGGVQLSDVISGGFSYMPGPGNPDQEPGDPTLGAYNVVDFFIDQAVVPITPVGIGIRHVPPVPTLPPLPPDLGTDGFLVAGSFLAGAETKVVALSLEAPYQTVLADDSLPASLTLGDFTQTRIVRAIRVLGLEPVASQVDQARVTSLVMVPEPPAVLLALVCLAGAGLLWRCAHYLRG